MKKLVRGDTDLALGRWDFMPAEVATQVVMPDSLVIAMPDTQAALALVGAEVGCHLTLISVARNVAELRGEAEGRLVELRSHSHVARRPHYRVPAQHPDDLWAAWAVAPTGGLFQIGTPLLLDGL
jgi:hypothetical protein